MTIISTDNVPALLGEWIPDEPISRTFLHPSNNFSIGKVDVEQDGKHPGLVLPVEVPLVPGPAHDGPGPDVESDADQVLQGDVVTDGTVRVSVRSTVCAVNVAGVGITQLSDVIIFIFIRTLGNHFIRIAFSDTVIDGFR